MRKEHEPSDKKRERESIGPEDYDNAEKRAKVWVEALRARASIDERRNDPYRLTRKRPTAMRVEEELLKVASILECLEINPRKALEEFLHDIMQDSPLIAAAIKGGEGITADDMKLAPRRIRGDKDLIKKVVS